MSPPTERSGIVDWEDIHRRLNGLAEIIARTTSQHPAERARILAERTRRLAEVEHQGPEPGESLEVLFFQLSGEDYGIESKYVQEVSPLEQLTLLPGVPPFVLGIVSLRGRIVSVVDLRKLFDLPVRGLTEQDRVITVTDGVMELGLLANEIFGSRHVAISGLQESLPTLTDIRRDFLKGITAQREVVLDGARLLSYDGIRVHQEG